MSGINPNISSEVKGKIGQYYRLLLSYADFKQAKFTAKYILENKLHDEPDSRLLESLNCAIIVAYCRPFSSNDRGGNVKIPNLTIKFLKDVSEDEKLIHQTVVKDRNKYMAHSDYDTSGLEPEVWGFEGNKVIVPWQYDRLAPLSAEATDTFLKLSTNLFEKVITERRRLEPEVIDNLNEKKLSREDFL